MLQSGVLRFTVGITWQPGHHRARKRTCGAAGRPARALHKQGRAQTLRVPPRAPVARARAGQVCTIVGYLSSQTLNASSCPSLAAPGLRGIPGWPQLAARARAVHRRHAAMQFRRQGGGTHSGALNTLTGPRETQRRSMLRFALALAPRAASCSRASQHPPAAPRSQVAGPVPHNNGRAVLAAWHLLQTLSPVTPCGPRGSALALLYNQAVARNPETTHRARSRGSLPKPQPARWGAAAGGQRT